MELLGFDVSMTWSLVIGAVLVFIWYDWWRHHYFQRRGIPVADYLPIFGNKLKWFQGLWKMMEDCHKKHGKVVGIYDFQEPILMISDPELLKNILVKNFSNFPNHRMNPMITLDPSPVGRGMFFLRGEDWKNIRNTLTPSFTAAKMKYMSPLINECCETLLASISKARSEGKAIDCRALFGGFTMDVIASCAFGLSVNSQEDKNSPFVENAKRLLDGRGLVGIAASIVGIFPFLAPLFAYLNIGFVFDPSSVKFFLGVTEAAFKMRKEEGDKASKRIDLLQLMMNAHNDTDVDPEDTPIIGDSPERGVAQRKALSTRDIMAQAVQFFLAGYETTNTLLTFTSYVLATNQDAQKKLLAEIDNFDLPKGNLGYEVVGKMEYLDMVISETLRMYPPLAFTTRVCRDTMSLDGGLVIDKDLVVFISLWHLHHNEEYWTEPYKFDPERFSPENKASIKPYTYMPFGFGPRICFGMRFALLEAKMALVRVLQQYRFDVCSETVIPIPLSTFGLIAPKKSMLSILPRN